MIREANPTGPNGLAADPMPEETETGPKLKGAASLTADVVARGRQRTQVYGEAGLWRGAGPPPPSEAPVRVVFPEARESEAKRAAEPEEPVREEPERVEAAAPAEPARVVAPTHEATQTGPDLGVQLIGAALVFAAVFVLGILLF